jgi:hypothetical protein
VSLPKNTFDRAEKKDVKLVNDIVSEFQAQYVPQEAIKGLQIVL